MLLDGDAQQENLEFILPVGGPGLRRGWAGRLESIFAEMSLGHRRVGGQALQLTKGKKKAVKPAAAKLKD